MAPQLPPLPIPGELAMPLRDVMRGLRRSVSGSAHMMEPVENALPDPIKQVMHRVAQRVAQDVSEPDPYEDLLELQEVGTLLGFGSDREAVRLFAQVSYRALKFAVRRLGRADLLVSETVIGLAYAAAVKELPQTAKPSEAAAEIVLSLQSHHAIGIAPGVGLALATDDRDVAFTSIIALSLWILTDRVDPQSEEPEVLSLCIDVAVTMEPQFAEVRDDPAALASLLEYYAKAI